MNVMQGVRNSFLAVAMTTASQASAMSADPSCVDFDQRADSMEMAGNYTEQDPEPSKKKKDEGKASPKTVVSLQRYFELQKEDGPTATHLKYTPFPQQMIDVAVTSTVHGDITLNFNTHTLKPRWVDKDKDGTVDLNEVSLTPTMAVITAVHSGLGDYNRFDAKSVKAAMNMMAKNVQVPSTALLFKATSDDHLDDEHGVDLFDYGIRTADGIVKYDDPVTDKNGKLVAKQLLMPGSVMKSVIAECKEELTPKPPPKPKPSKDSAPEPGL